MTPDEDRILRASVPEQFKGATSPIGAVQNYIVELEQIVRASWPFLFDDSGTPIAPEDLRQRVKDLGLSET
jgi:hypothetical protein